MPKTVPVLPGAPAPVGPYSVATEANGFVFISGQVASDPDGRPTPESTSDQAKMIMENIGRMLADLGLGYADIVKVQIFLVDIAEFSAVNQVYGSFFPSQPPARSTFQVAALPGSKFRIEIEAVAAR
jgi:2-iminobutanoate/2-iminopropanoate deaminase